MAIHVFLLTFICLVSIAPRSLAIRKVLGEDDLAALMEEELDEDDMATVVMGPPKRVGDMVEVIGVPRVRKRPGGPDRHEVPRDGDKGRVLEVFADGNVKVTLVDPDGRPRGEHAVVASEKLKETTVAPWEAAWELQSWWQDSNNVLKKKMEHIWLSTASPQEREEYNSWVAAERAKKVAEDEKVKAEWEHRCEHLSSLRRSEERKRQLVEYAGRLSFVLTDGIQGGSALFLQLTAPCLESLVDHWMKMELSGSARAAFLHDPTFGTVYKPDKLVRFLNERVDALRQEALRRRARQAREEQHRIDYEDCKSNWNACRGCGNSAEKWYGCHKQCNWHEDENTERGGRFFCDEGFVYCSVC